MARKERWIKKVAQLLRNSGVSISQTPTKMMFVSNSSVMCGVYIEDLEAAFRLYDTSATFIVYPRYKSYSFVIFSDVERAKNAFAHLNDTKPPNFLKEIALFYVTNLPENETPKTSKDLSGLEILPNFVSDDEETELIKFIESSSSAYLKNRRVLHYGYEFDYSQNCAFKSAEKIPPILNNLCERIVQRFSQKNLETFFSTGTNLNCSTNLNARLNLLKKCSAFRPDQITVNIYEAGQGIPSHVDTHSAFEEPIISLSLLSEVVMEFRDCANLRDVTGKLLSRRSLAIMTGSARYRYKHGILNRKYDVNPENNRLIHRRKRISITFRQIRRIPCECPFIEFCDWDRRGRMVVPDSDMDALNLESEYVSKVYEEIAPHFDETRKSNWGAVKKFLDNLPIYSTVMDAGCGNGKYLIRADNLCKFGTDLCEGLVRIAFVKNCHVFCGNALNLPVRSGSMDAALSIAVIHHFSTRERRLRALHELMRVLCVGGMACVTVWAMEQQHFNKLMPSEGAPIDSAYVRMKKFKNDQNIGEDFNSLDVDLPIEISNNTRNLRRLRVHDGRSTFLQQDMLIPWNSKPLRTYDDNRKQNLANSFTTRKGENETRNKLVNNNTCFDAQQENIPIPNEANTNEAQKQGLTNSSEKKDQFLRYYHLFVEGELVELVAELPNCRLIDVEFEEGNWVVVLQKK